MARYQLRIIIIINIIIITKEKQYKTSSILFLPELLYRSA